MKIMQKTPIIIILVAVGYMVPSGAHAAPTITGVSGTVSHGQTVTISGSGFGTKSPVAPLLWDPVDGMYASTVNGATVPTGSGYPWNASGGSDMYNPTFTTSNPRGKFIAKYTNALSPSSVRNAVLGGKSWSACSNAKLYLSYWNYPHQNLSNPGNSNKIMRLTENGGWSSNVSTVLWDTGTGALFTYSVAAGYTGAVYPSRGNIGAWNRLEVVVDNSVTPRPAVKAFVNNSQVASFQSSTSIASIIGIYTLGADWTNAQNSPIPQLDWGEIYVDSTLARVEICNANTKLGSTHCEIQIPQTTWIDSSIQLKVNQGSFVDGSSAYLFVVDASGNASAGKQITFGSTGSGTTLPVPVPDTTIPTTSITSPLPGATVSGSQAVNVTASDNISVTKVEFYVDGALANTLATSPYTFSWDTLGVANGSHVLSAKAYDAANNVGQSTNVSILVSNKVSSTTTLYRRECDNAPAGTIFCEDFEGTNPKSNFNDYDGNPDTENLIISDSGPSQDSSNKVIRLRVPAGQAGSSDLVKVLPSSYDKLYARWYFKYEPGFDFNARNHGGGLAAGDRSYIGQSGNRPSGSDFAGFYVQYMESSIKPYAYSYYRGMYQDCPNPVGSCWGDSLPCVYDSGASYCTKSQDRPTVSLPSLVAGQWYCYEQMVEMGTPSTTGTGATGRITQWLNGNTIADNTNLWLRTISTLKLQNLWLNLYHHDGTHSTVGEMIDNVVVSTQRIGCGGPLPVSAPSGVMIKQVIP